MKEREITPEDLEMIEERFNSLPQRSVDLAQFDGLKLTWEQKIWLEVGRLDQDMDDGLWADVWEYLKTRHDRST